MWWCSVSACVRVCGFEDVCVPSGVHRVGLYESVLPCVCVCECGSV